MKHLYLCLVLIVSLMMSLPVLAENFNAPDLSFSLSVPDSADHRAYLGLNDSRTFTLDQIKADVVILQIFPCIAPSASGKHPKSTGCMNRWQPIQR